MRPILFVLIASAVTAAIAIGAWYVVGRDDEADPAGTTGTVSTLEIGVHTGKETRDLAAARTLNSHVARVEFATETPVATVVATAEGYAAEGVRIQPLATFNRRVPTAADVASVRRWAVALSTAPKVADRADTAVRHIEFGNETSYADQGLQRQGRAYARQAKAAARALRGTGIGLLIQADDANQVDRWIDQMFDAVPDLENYADGWVVHPYGNEWERRLLQTIGQLSDHDARNRPIFITEFGFATDNGRCLSDNYGWDPCMSYAKAAETLDGVVDRLLRAYPQVAQLIVYNGLDLRVSGGTSTEREHYFGVLQSNGTLKGQYGRRVAALSASPRRRRCSPGPSIVNDQWVARCRPAP